jgi:UDP-N-acetylmuramate--alanine ligase
MPDAAILELARRGSIHFVGIGGAGMAGLAYVLRRRGALVTGCDRADSPVLRDLERSGIAVTVGHDAAHVEGAAGIVASAAVPSEHPELEAARRRGVPVKGRARALGELVNAGRLIAVAGTHGKTTTTAMTAQVLSALNIDPTALVGGRVEEWGGNARWGGEKVYVVEADEYDRSFLELRPELAVITTVELEHLDCYRDRADLEDAFARFAGPAARRLGVIACADDPGAARVAAAVADEHAFLYGLGPKAALRAENLSLRETRSLGRFELDIPGEHNVRNALAALAVALRFAGGEHDLEAVRAALAGFRGVERRFQVLGDAGGVIVVDDYAHHPTELAATIRAAREGWPERRLLVLFQPHLYSRTRDFAADFGRALAGADRAWVLDVYAAREAPIAGVSGALLADAAHRAGAAPGQVLFTPDAPDAVRAILDAARPGDLCLVLGAGDVWQAAREIHAGLAGKVGGDVGAR